MVVFVSSFWGSPQDLINYQRILIAGNATVDAKRQQSKKGDVKYTTFSVGVSDSKDKTIYFPIAVFGKHGEAVAKYVTKGFHVLVEGRIRVSDKGLFGVVADRVVFGPKDKQRQKAKKNN